ncbi:MAG: biopolymer transporter ExbD [Isosphaeraceae bacterium]
MLLRRQVSEERDEHIDMTPMVDVVFQLMTFLLFSVQMDQGPKVEVPQARHGVGVESDDATFLTLLPTGSADADLRILIGNGEGEPATLDQVRKAITDGLRQGRRKVVLQADGSVPHGSVLKLASVVAEVEGVSLNIGVQEPK